MASLTSVNIACGGHAGDELTMKTTVEQALRWKLAIGAHPGYPDRANFGRLELKLPAKEIADSVYDQVRALAEFAARCSARLTHVKPHGALYNQAVRNREIAWAIAEGVAGDIVRHNGVTALLTGEKYFRTGQLPWIGWLVSAAVSGALICGAAINFNNRDF